MPLQRMEITRFIDKRVLRLFMYIKKQTSGLHDKCKHYRVQYYRSFVQTRLAKQ